MEEDTGLSYAKNKNTAKDSLWNLLLGHILIQ